MAHKSSQGNTNENTSVKPKKPHEKLKVTDKILAFRSDLVDTSKRLIFCVGLPSTGKTRSAIECAIEQVQRGTYERLVIVRPVIVPTYGFLPGDSDTKMFPYIRQSSLYINKAVQIDLAEKIEVIPVDQLQGNRFFNSIVVGDEFQNVNMEETFRILSRVGENSKFILLGDTSRGQENRKVKDKSILNYAIEKFRDKSYVAVHEFYDTEDILGDEITKDVICTLLPDFL